MRKSMFFLKFETIAGLQSSCTPRGLEILPRVVAAHERLLEVLKRSAVAGEFKANLIVFADQKHGRFCIGKAVVVVADHYKKRFFAFDEQRIQLLRNERYVGRATRD